MYKTMPDSDKFGREVVAEMPVPEFEVTAFSKPPQLSEAKVALVTSAALHVGRDEAFGMEDKKFNVIDRKERCLSLGHWSANFERAAFASDINVVYPIDRLEELAERGVIGSVAEHHYAFAGNQDDMVSTVRLDTGPQCAQEMLAEGVDVVLLTPV